MIMFRYYPVQPPTRDGLILLDKGEQVINPNENNNLNCPEKITIYIGKKTKKELLRSLRDRVVFNR